VFTQFSIVAGFCWTVVMCAFFQTMFYFGYGEPNVIPEAGESYTAWWLTLFFCNWVACVLAGVILDLFALAYKTATRNNR
jgi:hypothetical protein